MGSSLGWDEGKFLRASDDNEPISTFAPHTTVSRHAGARDELLDWTLIEPVGCANERAVTLTASRARSSCLQERLEAHALRGLHRS